MSLVLVPPFKLQDANTIVPRLSSVNRIIGNAGLTIYGGSTSSNNLYLSSTTNSTKGSVALDDKVLLWPTYVSTISGSLDTINFTNSTTSINTSTTTALNYFLNATPTYSIDSSIILTTTAISILPNFTYNSGTAWIAQGINFGGTYTYTANPGFGNSWTGFICNPTVLSGTTSITPPNILSYTSNITARATANNIGTIPAVTSYLSNDIITSTGASTVITVTNCYGFRSLFSIQAQTSGGSTTVTNRIGAVIADPSYTATGNITITNNIGYQFLNQSSTSGNRTITTIKGLDLQQNTGTGGTTAWNIYSSGTASSSHAGAFRIGDNTAPTEKLEVLGNALLGTASSTTGILKLANASSANVTGLQGGNATSAVTYTLPTADGSNGQVLTTNGSAAMSWTTPSGSGNAIIQTKFKTSDTARTTQTGNDPDLVSLTTTSAKYMFEGWLWVTASTTTPDIVINVTVTGSSVNFFQISYNTFAADGTAGIDNGALTGSGVNSSVIQVIVNGNFIVLRGYLDLTGAGSLALQWQRNGASGTTTLKQGSWLRTMQL